MLENKIVLTNAEADYFIVQDLKERALEKDTALLLSKINLLNKNIFNYSKALLICDSISSLRSLENSIYQKNIDDLSNKLNRDIRKMAFQRKVIGLTGSSLCLSILYISLFILK